MEFANKVPFYGAAVVCLDDANVQSILPAIRRRTITYGTTAQSDMEAGEIACGSFSSDFRLRTRGIDLGRFHLRIPGRHNVLNATAAVTAIAGTRHDATSALNLHRQVSPAIAGCRPSGRLRVLIGFCPQATHETF